MPFRSALLAALWMDCLARLIATQEARGGDRDALRRAADPGVPGRDGAGRARPGGLAVGLAAGLPDAAAEAECVAETAGFTVPVALPHAVTATAMPVTTGTAKCPAFICTIAAFPGN